MVVFKKLPNCSSEGLQSSGQDFIANLDTSYCVYRSTLEARMRNTCMKSGILGWLERQKTESATIWIRIPMIKKVFYVCPCTLREVKEINTVELLQSKALKTVNLSVNLLLTSLGWVDRVCSEFSMAETGLGSKPLHPCEMKQDRTESSHVHIRNWGWRNTGKKQRSCVTDLDCVIFVLSHGKDLKWDKVKVRSCSRKYVDHSLRGTAVIVCISFCIFLLVSQLKKG